MKRRSLLFFTCILSLTSFSQTLIMNEVSQGVTGNMEYVEFVVVDTAATYNCGLSVPPSIDIRGWIFDDNSGYHGTGGIAAGAVRFSNDPLWAAIPMGTLILIYNDASPDPSIPSIDLTLSDGNCSIVAPISSPTLFESNSTTPGAIACSYPSTGWTPGGNWSNTLLANSGDCARIVNLLGCEVFSVCYGDVNLNTQIYFNAGAELPADHRNTVYYFNDGDPLVQSNWSLACTDNETVLDANQCGGNFQTPGLPNNPANEAFIGQFNNNCTPIPPLVASAGVDANEACGCDGQATASPSGSIPGYTYEWFDASMLPIGQTSQTATGLCAGTYHVTVTSSIGCTETATVSVNPGLTPSSSTISGGGSYCTNVNPTGVDVTISLSGTGPWDLVYTDGTTSYPLNNVISSPVTLNNVTSGTYQVTSLTDGFGCPGTSPGSVPVNSLSVPTALISGGNNYCTGSLVNDISVAVTGVPSWTLSYTVDGGATQTTTATSSPISLGNSPGSYSITLIEDANCTGLASGSQAIVVNPLPVISSVNGGGTYCAGDMVGDVTVDVTGSPGWLVSYTIDGGPTQTISASSSPISLGNADGVYSVTAISDLNCTNTASGIQEISINPLPAVTSISGGTNYCEGDVIGDILVDVSGSPAWTLTYSVDGGPMQTITSSTSPISLGNLEGVYTVVSITDANCTGVASGSQTIVVNPLPVISSVNGGGTYCAGDLVGDVTVDVTGSPGWSVSYSIDGGPTQTVSASFSPISLGNSEGIYSVTAISDLNCTNTASGIQEISINPLPAVTSISGGTNYCEGDVIGDILVDVSGSPAWTLTYSVDGGPMQSIISSTSPISLGNLEGVYLLTAISDAFCSNTASGTQTILINPVPAAPLAGTDATYCIGSELLPITVSGGSGGFVWYSDETLTNPIGNGTTMMPSEILGTANYYVNEQLNGCSGPADMVTISIIPCDITIPTAFTPDGDNVNDVWNIQDLDLNYPENQVFVYNRWGSLLYTSDKGKYSTKPWNGTFNDKELPVGSYYFIIETGDEPLNGVVSIVKE